MLVFGLLIREAELEYRGRTLGGADRQYQGTVTVGGIAVGPQPPLFDENLCDTGHFVDPCGPLGPAFGHCAELGRDVDHEVGVRISRSSSAASFPASMPVSNTSSPGSASSASKV